jgi:hypothetical protein
MKSADFKKIVTKELAPVLRKNGWKGSGFDYTIHKDNIIKGLTIQPSGSGGKFCIEVGIHFDFIPLTVEKEFSKMKAWDMDIRSRLTPNNDYDFWWNFPKTEDQTRDLFEELVKLISSIGESYFEKFINWEDNVLKFSPEDVEEGVTKKLINITQMRTALLLARINKHLNNNEKAIEFSEYGLSKVNGNKGAGLIPHFEEIIKK